MTTTPSDSDADAVREQQDYYRARAPEYDEWWARKGRYDRGPAHTAAWIAEGQTVRHAFLAHGPLGEVWDFAGGTGRWSGVTMPNARSITAVDSAAEMLAIHAARIGSRCAVVGVPYTQHEADLLDWDPPGGAADTIIMGFFLSHVPAEWLAPLIDRVVLPLLRPGGRVLIVDSTDHASAGARNHPPVDAAADRSERHLNDGRVFTIVKRFWTPAGLDAPFHAAGFEGAATTTREFFLHAAYKLRQPPQHEA